MITKIKRMRKVRDTLQQHWKEGVLDDLLEDLYIELVKRGFIKDK